MKRGYQESSSSGSLRPPQSKIRHNPEGDARFLEDESTKVFDRKVADHYSARMNQTLEEHGASPIIHLKKLNNCIESVLIQLYAHRGDAVLDLACGKKMIFLLLLICDSFQDFRLSGSPLSSFLYVVTSISMFVFVYLGYIQLLQLL